MRGGTRSADLCKKSAILAILAQFSNCWPGRVGGEGRLKPLFDAVDLSEFTRFEMVNIFQGNTSNFSHGFAGEKGLMAGDNDIGEREQARKHVVLQQLIGIVFKEEISFFFVDI